MQWMWIIAALGVAFVIFKLVVKPLLKVALLAALVLAAYFWLWPLLTSSS